MREKLVVKYSRLVETYEKLEQTQATLEKTDILAELFDDAGEELEDVVLLSMGRAFPYWKDLDLGISSRTMVDIIREASGKTEGEIEQAWKEEGDLGSAAERILEGGGGQQSLMQQELTVQRVNDKLEKVARMEEESLGSVSMDKKKKEVAALLNDASPQEAKYIVRTFIENLRLGVGEGIIRDALAESFFDGKNQEEIQRAYDLTNDFKEVAGACRKGVEALQELEIELFRPIKSMLAKKVETIEKGFEEVGKPAAVDYKYDGFRCISGYTPIYVEGKGIVSVRDVTTGDRVLTHEGRFRKVEAKNRRQIEPEERIFEFSTYLGNDFKITEGHEILTEEGWKKVENLDSSDFVLFPIPDIKSEKNKPKKLELSRKGGYTKKISIDKDFWRFVGFWIGDGYSNRANDNKRIGLVFDEDEEELFSSYRAIVRETLEMPQEQLSSHIHNGGRTLYWTDPPMLEWLAQNFRKQGQSGWKDKRIPEWFWNLEEDEFRMFLEGWVEADGQKNEEGKFKNVTTKERALATSTQMIAAKHGITCGIRKLRIDGNTYYRLVFTTSNKHASIENGWMKVQILKNEELSRISPREVDPRQKVYNLQVKGDESYCTTTVALHNCQIHSKDGEVRAFTRRLEDVTEQFPDVAEFVEEHVDADEFIIDAEVIAYDPEDGSTIPFQELSRRVKRKYDIQEMREKIPVEVRPFDLLYHENSRIENPYHERFSELEDLIGEEKHELRLADREVTGDEERVSEMQQRALQEGHEGIMMKNLDARYKPGSRVGYMVKLKPVMETLDLAIIGAKWSEGRRSGWLGRLKLGVRDEDSGEYRQIGKMATGLTDEQLEKITQKLEPLITREQGRDVEVKPEVIVEVEYEEIQQSPTYSSGYALRFPRMKQFREDKEEADSLERVERLYEQQQHT